MPGGRRNGPRRVPEGEEKRADENAECVRHEIPARVHVATDVTAAVGERGHELDEFVQRPEPERSERTHCERERPTVDVR